MYVWKYDFRISLKEPGKIRLYKDRPRAERSKNLNSIPGRGKIFFSTPQRLHCPRTHPTSYRMSTGVLSSGVQQLGLKLTTHLHLVPRLRMHGSIPPLSHTSTWHKVLPLPSRAIMYKRGSQWNVCIVYDVDSLCRIPLKFKRASC
jgi:hypothetical protein